MKKFALGLLAAATLTVFAAPVASADDNNVYPRQDATGDFAQVNDPDFLTFDWQYLIVSPYGRSRPIECRRHGNDWFDCAQTDPSGALHKLTPYSIPGPWYPAKMVFAY